MAADNFQKLKRLLEELFQLDQAELDFGIYRIMNTKRDEVVRFLDQDLLPQVKEAFGEYQSADTAEIRRELDKLVASVTAAGMNPDDSPKVQELREKLATEGVDVAALENDVYSHLFSFFRRYYHEGDFISLRRYKEGVYAIPYEGEEVKLHWANHDQYYIKSSEYLRDYVFKLSSGKRVRVHLVSASTEQDNKKEAPGKERRFVLAAEDPLYEQNGELYIRFEYRPDDGGKKQAELNQAAIEAILAKGSSTEFRDWINELAKPAPTERNSGRTVLERHLSRYTARNTFDYFIHKDLGGFLRRELDFYIKNEVMHLDDIEHDSVPRVEQYLSKIKVIRKIAHKIILFLEQLENFQKKLWLKKKFVVETNYCITLDRVPEELYPEISANDAQREEWVKLFAIDEIEEDLGRPGYSIPLTVAFLGANDKLPLNTALFPRSISDRIIAATENLDSEMSGVALCSENLQALRLLRSAYEGKIKGIYIDPPYNTGGDGFAYKDSFQHSSWIAMIEERLLAARPLLNEMGVIFSSIDWAERNNLEFVLDSVFGVQNRVEELIWVQNATKNQSPTYSTNHEYVAAYSKQLDLVKSNYAMFRESKPGYVEIMELIEELNSKYPPITEIEAELKNLFKAHKKEVASLGEQGLDDWKGIYNYNRAEYRDSEGHLVKETEARKHGARLWVWREDNPSMPQIKEDSQKAEFRDPESPTFRFYKPEHPITKLPCSHPKTGWRWPYAPHGKQKTCFSELASDDRIAWGEDESKIPQTKRFLHEAETKVAISVINDYTDGEKELTNLFGTSRTFGGPKPTTLIGRLCDQVDLGDGIFCDFFAGSGTTGEAVISRNREREALGKFLLVEAGNHFYTVLLPRLCKVAYAQAWKDGLPKDRVSGVSLCIKFVKLESYEDSLSNLELTRTDDQSSLLHDCDLREQYLLSYMLDVESRGSQSLLNVDSFRNPDEYKLKVERNGETQLVNVDLVETFNWLLGLTVKHIDHIRGVRVVEGTSPDGERVLVLWRNLDETDNDALDAWFKKQGYNTKDQDYDAIYVNGDNNLENLRRTDQTWKVRLTEEHFHRLMFEDCDA